MRIAFDGVWRNGPGAGLVVLLAATDLSACCLTPNNEPAADEGRLDAGAPPDAGPPAVCTIAGNRYSDGSLNPLNQCQSCQPATSASSWSSFAPGWPCADAGICSNGACLQGCLIDGGVVLSGTFDTGGCLECLPWLSLTSWTTLSYTPCGATGTPNVCVAGRCETGCLIGGELCTPNLYNSQNECQSCQPTVSTSSWTNLPIGTSCRDGGTCDSNANCIPSFGGCTVGPLQVTNGRSNPSDPSLCCNATLDPSGWTARFVPAGSFPSYYSPNELVVADFNRDGWPDLAAVGLGDNDPGSVTVFLNSGGTLTKGETYLIGYLGGSGRGAITAVDLDLDGFTDLVVAADGDKTLNVLVGKGDGTFQSPVSYPAEGAKPGWLKAGDFNHDGFPDLVLGGEPLLFFAGIGDGGLLPGVPLASYGPGTLAVADFNGDGLPDIASATFGFGSHGPMDAGVRFLEATLSGGLQFAGSYPAPPEALSLWDISVGDLNGDGAADLAVAVAGLAPPNGSIGVLLNRGDGTFDGWTSYSVAGNAFSVAIADLDGDGDGEVLFTNSGNSDHLSQLNLADGGTSGEVFAPGVAIEMDAVVVGDFNGDHAPDIAAIASPGIVIYLNGCP